MKTILIILAGIVAIFVAIFVVGFIWATISAASPKGRKREQAQAALLLAQIPKGAFGVLLLVFAAFKLNDVNDVNRQTTAHPSETTALLEILARPRDLGLSAGSGGDRLNLSMWSNGLLAQGYHEQAATVIAYVYHHHLESLLEEVIQNRRWESARQ